MFSFLGLTIVFLISCDVLILNDQFDDGVSWGYWLL